MAALNALKMKRLTEPGRYTDGRGLMLVIGKDGSRKWVLRVQHQGRRRDIGLGPAADVSLSDAREVARDMRKAIRQGRDPVAERRAALAKSMTFEDTARAVHKEHAASWRNKKHAAQWLSTLEAYVFPKFGEKPVKNVDSGMVRDALAEIWLTKPETARRVRQRIGMVLDFAHAKGWRDTEANMRAVSKALPKQARRDEHFAAMPWKDVPAFIAAMPEKLTAGEPVRLALQFVIFTAARSGEVRGARWSEFDLEEAMWTVPAERMKGGRAHRIPLSDAALAVLRRMAEVRRNAAPDAYVFEGIKLGRPLSDMTLSMPLRRAKLGITVHGFRSAFRDWCAEATTTPREVAEAALAHVVKDKTEAAYARSDLYERRASLMQAWADFLTREGKVVDLPRRRAKA